MNYRAIVTFFISPVFAYVVGIALNLSPVTSISAELANVEAKEYVGMEKCAVCHSVSISHC